MGLFVVEFLSDYASDSTDFVLPLLIFTATITAASTAIGTSGSMIVPPLPNTKFSTMMIDAPIAHAIVEDTDQIFN